ncbi:MAG TPA: hypothetical protein VM324_01395 [Egibacteraceae bacterium]|nr:hypothetical protein [Egibacteraceae bacterium]
MKVLLVSTNPRLSLQVTTAVLGEPDVEVLEVRTPQRVLQQLDDEGGFGLVIADADTAPTGGFALVREVKARAQMGAEMPPVILLLAREADKYLAKWSQADAFILKPPDPFDLAEVVRALRDGRPVPALPRVGVPRGPMPADVTEALGGVNVAGGTVVSSGP